MLGPAAAGLAVLLTLGSVSLGPSAFGQQPGSAVSPALEPTSGSLLIASRWLADPAFGESVILLIEAGQKGAIGVMLNRRTSISVAEALPQIGALGDSDDVLYARGLKGHYSDLIRYYPERAFYEYSYQGVGQLGRLSPLLTAPDGRFRRSEDERWVKTVAPDSGNGPGPTP